MNSEKLPNLKLYIRSPSVISEQKGERVINNYYRPFEKKT